MKWPYLANYQVETHQVQHEVTTSSLLLLYILDEFSNMENEV